VLGTDDSPLTPVAGFGAHEELRLLVSGGLTPFEAVRTGTTNARRAAGGSDRWGVVAVGARADLVLVGGNPLADVGSIRRPRGVMVRGRWYDRPELDSLLNAVILRRSGG
jgi:imidazolonepropionase-like amidohydrolase